MQQEVLKFLSCPVCKEELRLRTIRTNKKRFETFDKVIIETGILSCSCDFLFPIIESVPRMLIESFIDHENFFRQNVPGFSAVKQKLFEKYGDLIYAAQARNKQTKASFSFEWNLLKGKRPVNVWHLTKDEYKAQLFNELDLTADFFKYRLAIDVGCGHGRSTVLLGEKCGTSIGVDLGLSVIKACAENTAENCHFIQADLHHLPFADQSFDIVYSSGVLHHTPNTSKAFAEVAHLVNGKGTYCVWLYRPSSDRVNKIINWFRNITVHLPLRMQFWLYLIFFVPLHKFISWVRGRKSRSWREIMIELLDSFSPRYRFEHEPGEVSSWLKMSGFTGIKTTTKNEIGFSIKGTRRIAHEELVMKKVG